MLKVKRVVEGRTTLYVPDLEAYAAGERAGPWSAPVFYNPKGAPTRDVSVSLVAALGGRPRVLDAMCGVGARGVRIAVESQASEVVLNDVNPDALGLAFRSSVANGVSERVRFESVGANALCAAHEHGERFDYVDVDPFGSVAPFLPAALLAVKDGGVLGVCSTDAANLCGNRARALYRLYFAQNRYKLGVKEAGLRILLGFAVRVAASMGFAAEPILCYYYGDYFRCHFKVYRSPAKAEELLEKVGYLHECVDGWRYGGPPPCADCGGGGFTGPLWTGNLASKSFAVELLGWLERMGTTSSKVALEIVSRLIEEDEVTLPYIDLHRLVRGRGLSPPGTQEVVSKLRGRGYKASRTHFDGRGIKTDAPMSVVLECVREFSAGTA